MARSTKNFVVAKKNNLKNSSKLHSISNASSRRHKIDTGGNQEDQSAITSVNIKENIMKNRIITNKKSNCLVLMSVQLILLLVLLNYYVDVVESHEIRTRQHKAMQDREPRKMFGGYKITPKFCTPSRPSRRYRATSNDEKRGPAICMFNHECLQRQGEVVGSCMDGFLFGACCQLYGTPGVIRDTVEDGVVMPQNMNFMNTDLMTPDKLYNIKDEDLSLSVPQIINSLFDSSNYMKTTDKYDAATVKEGSSSILADAGMKVEVENSVVKHPSTLAVSMNVIPSSTHKYDDLMSSGVAHITNTLLHHTPSDADIVNLGKLPDTGLFSLSTISHEEPDTYLVDQNGSVIMDYAKPSDFSSIGSNIEVSTMQTKPAMTTQKPSTTLKPSKQPQKPLYNKPVFKPKPTKPPPVHDKFVLVQTVTKPNHQDSPSTSNEPTSSQSELASIESIITMLNDSRPLSVSINSQTTPMNVNDNGSDEKVSTTAIPQVYSSGLPPVSTFEYVSMANYPTGGYYVTTSVQKYTTSRPITTTQAYRPLVTKRPSITNHHISSSGFFTRRPSTQAPTIPSSNDNENDNVVSSTLSYDEYWGSPSDSYTSPFPDRKPPSTSYVYGPTPTKRPSIHNVGPNYDAAGSLDTFSSVTPTVIVLDSLSPQYDSYTPKPIKLATKPESSENIDNYVQIPLKPSSSSGTNNKNNSANNVLNKKPVHQVTINNIISSTNMIHLGNIPNPPVQTVSSTERPSPTVLITPKPTTIAPQTNTFVYLPKPEKPSDNAMTTLEPFTTSRPSSLSDVPLYYTVPNRSPPFAPFDATTTKNEVVTSPDDFINFPPVRNPNLEVSGGNHNHNIFNNTISLSGDEVALPDVEFTTPALVPEDDDLNDKMSLFVNKIVGSFQGTFQELHDIVILDKSPSVNLTQPTRRPTTKRPSTTKKPVRVSTPSTSTTKKPPTKKPKPTTRRPTATTTTEATTIISTRKPTKASTTPKPKPKPTKAKTTTQPPTTITTEETIAEEGETFTTETPSGDFKHLCGVRPLVKSGRIVGGKGATFGEWPWQVLVRESTWLGLFTKNKCGGVLITNSYVTTAAHCQPGFLASLVAVMGEFDISGDLESKRSVTKNVKRVIVHRNYDAATFENDLALLELESPVVFDVHIVPICMPPNDADFTGRFATVTGWGRLKYGGGVPSVLQEVRVPVIENSVCQEMFHTAGHSKVILNSFLCAGYANGQKDSCEGDSGGPLVLQRPDGRWELAGTVSHGIKCAAPYLPGVYMRTTFYKPWLKSITGVQ